MRLPIIVLKFGSSVLRSEEDAPRAVHEIYRWYRQGFRVVAIVSAFAGSTDKLLQRAESRSASPDAWATAALVSTGEAYSAAVLALELDRAGIPAAVLEAHALGLETCGPRLNADPVCIDTEVVLRHLQERPVAIVPGFVGRHADGSHSLLGRGGSDLSAIFIAQKLGAQCRLIKDVDGLYEHDPALHASAPRRFQSISFGDASRLDAGIVQPKAIQFARQQQFAFEVGAVASDVATEVGHSSTTFGSANDPNRKLRVGLLGLGTVGLGVLHRLLSEPERFTVCGAAVRDRDKKRDLPVPERLLLTTDPREIVESDCDVVFELIGGLTPAEELVRSALDSGKHVVTANKLLLAAAGKSLLQQAAHHDLTLSYSAAVGGAVPMLETVKNISRKHEVVEIAGVLNGTCNFILDQIAQGRSLKESITLAQSCGFTEADPIHDLQATDAAQKLLLLTRAAFGAQAVFSTIQVRGILSIPETEVRALAASGQSVRLVARARKNGSRIDARISPEILSADHVFAQVHNEHNCLVLTTSDGQSVTLRGRGAGRWPTAEAVFADALDLWRQHNQSTRLWSVAALGRADESVPAHKHSNTYEEEPLAGGAA
ncbi:MAG: aspartate kinase [Candidatus Angelobacter sp. Gp1-AA117]|nr:MAG: aspartate kinase [Candidatus Angelobacter sp. Gp1-AA117]